MHTAVRVNTLGKRRLFYALWAAVAVLLAGAVAYHAKGFALLYGNRGGDDFHQRWIELSIANSATGIVLFTPEGHEDRVGSFFNGGVRAYSIADPHAPVEIGYLVDASPPGNASHTIQINDVYVDEHGLIYANDRLTGGLDIIRYTGTVPLE